MGNSVHPLTVDSWHAPFNPLVINCCPVDLAHGAPPLFQSLTSYIFKPLKMFSNQVSELFISSFVTLMGVVFLLVNNGEMCSLEYIVAHLGALYESIFFAK